MNQTIISQTTGLGRKRKILYGFGSIAVGIKDNAFNTLLLFFYTQVMGLSGFLAGLAIFLALVVDAITDPIVGQWSDGFHSRLGRRHPFIYASALPMGVAFYLTFSPSPSLGEMPLFLWMLSSAILVRVSMTLYAIPSSSLLAEMTSDYDERTSIMSYRVFFAWVGGLGIAILGYLVFFAPNENYTDGRLDPSGYLGFALTGAILIVAAILICAFSTHSLIPSLYKPTSAGFTLRQYKIDMLEILKNKDYMRIVATVLLVVTASGFFEAIALYMNTYYWELSTKQLSVILLASAVGSCLSFVLTPILSAKVDKGRMAKMVMAFMACWAPLPIVLRSVGLFPDNGSVGLQIVLMIFSGALVMGALSISILIGSMIADNIDRNYVNTGKRQEGIYNAFYTFLNKATSGLGGFLAGVSLDIIQFPTGVEASEIAPGTLDTLGYSVAIVLFVLWFFAFYVISKYSLNRVQHQEIVRSMATVEQVN